MDHVGDGHKHYRLAITSILYNECLRRRCLTKKGNVAQVEFYNIDMLINIIIRKHPVIPFRAPRVTYSSYDSPTAKWAASARVGLFLSNLIIESTAILTKFKTARYKPPIA